MPLLATRHPGNDGWGVEWRLDDGASVSRLTIVNRDMRIGSAVVRIGGIAGVGTNRDQRNKGYASRVMHGANDVMAREGYDLGFLFGIRDFYHRFGYASCLPEHEWKVETRNAERAEGCLRTRGLRKTDFPALVRLYNRDNASRTGSVVRAPRWPGFPHGSFFGRPVAVQVVLDARDRVAGYVACDDDADRCRVSEVGGAGHAVHDAILWFLAARAVRLRREEISFAMPTDHPFARWARDFGIQESTRYPFNGNGMGRIANLGGLFRKLAPELSTRLAQHARKPPVSRVTLVTDIGSVTLSCDRGAVSVSGRPAAVRARIAQHHLTQLVMGYRTVDDLATAGRLRASSAARGTLALFFPPQTAHMWWADRF